jgi:hypothetical protein
MSRVLTDTDGVITEDIESMEICRWRVNYVCCNDSSEYLADYPECNCKSKKDCINYTEEDGLLS